MSDGEMPIDVVRFDHTGFAVRSIDESLRLFGDLLGGVVIQREAVAEQGFDSIQLEYPGGSRIELLEPTGAGFVKDFLDARGEGVQHLTFYVADLERAVAAARSSGMRVVDERHGRRGNEAFLSPKSAHGTVVQLIQARPRV